MEASLSGYPEKVPAVLCGYWKPTKRKHGVKKKKAACVCALNPRFRFGNNKKTCFTKIKRKKEMKLWIYFFLLTTMVANATAIIITAAPIAMYVVVGAPLVGGITALGDGEVV